MCRQLSSILRHFAFWTPLNSMGLLRRNVRRWLNLALICCVILGSAILIVWICIGPICFLARLLPSIPNILRLCINGLWLGSNSKSIRRHSRISSWHSVLIKATLKSMVPIPRSWRNTTNKRKKQSNKWKNYRQKYSTHLRNPQQLLPKNNHKKNPKLSRKQSIPSIPKKTNGPGHQYLP